MVGKTHSFYRI